MSYLQHITKAVVFNASAGATQSFNTSYIVNGGVIEAITYTQGTASNISTAAGITITAANSGITLLDVTATGAAGTPVTFFPRGKAQDTSGGQLGYTSAATPPAIPTRLPVGQEVININIACATAGGTPSAASGGLNITFDLYISGN